MAIEALKLPAGSPAGKKHKISAAGHGAIAAASLMGAANAALWITKPKDMNVIVKDFGGKNQYAMSLAIGIAMFSAVGAGINTILNAIAKKAPAKQPPKAAN